MFNFAICFSSLFYPESWLYPLCRILLSRMFYIKNYSLWNLMIWKWKWLCFSSALHFLKFSWTWLVIPKWKKNTLSTSSLVLPSDSSSVTKKCFLPQNVQFNFIAAIDSSLHKNLTPLLPSSYIGRTRKALHFIALSLSLASWRED